MWWNHLIWCCSHGEKCKKQKKTRRFSKSFTSYLHIRSTSEHNSTRFGKLQCRATSFIFWPFLVIGHVTTLSMTYWMDPDRQTHPCVVVLHFFIKLDPFPLLGRTMTWTLKAVPDGRYNICAILFFIRNSHISIFGYLLWTLKSPPNNTDHNPDFFLISWLFYC